MRKGKILTVSLVDTQDSLAEWMFTYLCWWEKWPKGMESRTDPGQLKGKWTTLLITLAPALSHLQPLGHPCSVSNMLTCSISEIKLQTSVELLKKQESSRKTSIFALLNMQKPLTVWITTNCGNFLKRWEYQTTWPASWEICMQVRKQQLAAWNNRLVPNRERNMSRLLIYCHRAYLTYMQSK